LIAGVPTGDNKLVFVDLESRTITGEMDIGSGPMGIGFSTDSKSAFVGLFGQTYFAHFDIENKSYEPIDTGAAYNEEFAIDDSAAPIRGEAGKLVGTVLVFRDVSNKRREERRRSFLTRATAELSASLDHQQTLSTLARLAVPAIADLCTVDIRDGGGWRRLAVEHIDAKKRELLFELERRYPVDPNRGGQTIDIRLSGEPVSLGRPIDNARIYLLDAAMELGPAGVPGELYIGGEGLARGYHQRPDLTAEQFVPDPFSAQPGARLYRSGDRAAHREDGQLRFLGRIDDQLKLRGYRIEPGEIERQLERQSGIERAVVVAHQDERGHQRLVAYAVRTSDAVPAIESEARFLQVARRQQIAVQSGAQAHKPSGHKYRQIHAMQSAIERDEQGPLLLFDQTLEA